MERSNLYCGLPSFRNMEAIEEAIRQLLLDFNGKRRNGGAIEVPCGWNGGPLEIPLFPRIDADKSHANFDWQKRIYILCVLYRTMIETFTVIVEQGEDGYLISDVIELPGCHTQAKALNELMIRTKEAIELYLEVEKPVEIKQKFLGLQQIRIKV